MAKQLSRKAVYGAEGRLFSRGSSTIACRGIRSLATSSSKGRPLVIQVGEYPTATERFGSERHCPGSCLPLANRQPTRSLLTAINSLKRPSRTTQRPNLKPPQFSSQKDSPSPLSPSNKSGATSVKQSIPTATVLPPSLHENIYTLPNFLTLTRLLAAPLTGYLIAQDLYPHAVGVFLYAGLTDLVDGWIARRWNMQTVVGTVVDPMADKALMTVVTVALAVKGAVPVLLATLILGRDILLGVSALYYRYISLPPPKTLARFWDFSLPSAEVRPTSISKINTFLQLGLLGGTMLWMATTKTTNEIEDKGGEGEDSEGSSNEQQGKSEEGKGWLDRFRAQPPAQQALEIGWYVVGLTTVWSGLSYVGWGRRRGLRILSEKSKSSSRKKST